MKEKKKLQYRREVLLKDPRFARYQPDFLAAVLNKPYYTRRGAGRCERFLEGVTRYGSRWNLYRTKTKSGRAFTFASGRRTNRI